MGSSYFHTLIIYFQILNPSGPYNSDGKRYLQVHNKASNIACRAELSKFPMIIDINKKILNYLDYLIGKNEDSIDKQALQISIDLHHNGKTNCSFYSNLMKMIDYTMI